MRAVRTRHEHHRSVRHAASATTRTITRSLWGTALSHQVAVTVDRRRAGYITLDETKNLWSVCGTRPCTTAGTCSTKAKT